VGDRRGPGGATPLMYAALYGDAGMVRDLLERGADTDARNEAGATALMWAVPDVQKARLLLDAGADANARSNDGRTALLIAAGRRDGMECAILLLSRGATPAVKGQTVPTLAAAASGGNGKP